MRIDIPTNVARDALDRGKLAQKLFKVDPEKWTRWHSSTREDKWDSDTVVVVDLRRHPKKSAEALLKALESAKDVKGAEKIARHLRIYLGALAGGAGNAKCRSLRSFADLLTSYLAPVAGHRVYARDERDQEVCWYVDGVGYNPPQKQSNYTIPAYAWMRLMAEDFNSVRTTSVSWRDAQIAGKTVAEVLTESGYWPETSELREKYLDLLGRFTHVSTSVGKQFLASGVATDDCDGNSKRDTSWYWRRTNLVAMTREGAPSRVVADVFFEEATEKGRRETVSPSRDFWSNQRALSGDEDETEDDGEDGSEVAGGGSQTTVGGERDAELVEVDDFIEVPVHPYVCAFDLSRHLRVKLHVNQLEDYPYDAAILDKLVMSPERKKLVDLLVNMRSGDHNDVVKGKSGGAVVLLAGPPGVGKTLTAEVFAERDGRALYSVQCSQLGVDPETLEESLLKIFARTRRWNAVLLLDEADVYVHERGNDMNQNAVVGVFLRTLEYQSSVLFLTTNRPDDVDDAIASRCVARLGYEKPDALQQAQLWRVLCDAAKKPITDATIKQLVTRAEAKGRHDSGRDIKNLVKLASLMTEDGSVTVEHVEYVRQFKPTS